MNDAAYTEIELDDNYVLSVADINDINCGRAMVYTSLHGKRYLRKPHVTPLIDTDNVYDN